MEDCFNMSCAQIEACEGFLGREEAQKGSTKVLLGSLGSLSWHSFRQICWGPCGLDFRKIKNADLEHRRTIFKGCLGELARNEGFVRPKKSWTVH